MLTLVEKYKRAKSERSGQMPTPQPNLAGTAHDAHDAHTICNDLTWLGDPFQVAFGSLSDTFCHDAHVRLN